MYYDIVIIGSGIAGLYSAYLIKKISPVLSFIILEKNNKKWIGGRTNNDTFRGSQIVTGAGIIRKNKDKLLMHLLKDLKLGHSEFDVDPYYSKEIETVVNINDVIQHLKKQYGITKPRITFKEFASIILGDKGYNDFIISSGYTDYENADAYDVLYNYGMDDNACCWKAISVNWKQLISALAFHNSIGLDKIKTSMNVVNIEKKSANPCRFIIKTDKGKTFESNKVIIATNITGIMQLIPRNIYSDIKGQNFLRLYGKFSKKSDEILKEYVKGYIVVPGPLQKIIPMSNGVYMIAYSDGAHATYLKKYLENTKENRTFFCNLLASALGISAPLKLLAIKDYYWNTGTHYYLPLHTNYNSREEFIHDAQHPEDGDGILVVGEVVSLHQGWVNGALESVQAVLTKKWINSER